MPDVPRIPNIHSALFATRSGHSVSGWQATVPIMRADADGRTLECIGTGFFVHPTGILVSAAHVLNEPNDARERAALNRLPDPKSGLLTWNWTDEGVNFRRIEWVCVHTKSDVGVATTVRLDGKSAPVTHMALTLKLGQPGDEVSIFGYPKPDQNQTADSGSIMFQPEVYPGSITRVSTEPRDAVLVRAAAYEIDVEIEGKASGSPVINSNGHVFAVASTSLSNGGPTSASFIQQIGGLEVPFPPDADADDRINVTIRSLMDSGEITLLI